MHMLILLLVVKPKTLFVLKRIELYSIQSICLCNTIKYVQFNSKITEYVDPFQFQKLLHYVILTTCTCNVPVLYCIIDIRIAIQVKTETLINFLNTSLLRKI